MRRPATTTIACVCDHFDGYWNRQRWGNIRRTERCDDRLEFENIRITLTASQSVVNNLDPKNITWRVLVNQFILMAVIVVRWQGPWWPHCDGSLEPPPRGRTHATAFNQLLGVYDLRPGWTFWKIVFPTRICHMLRRHSKDGFVQREMRLQSRFDNRGILNARQFLFSFFVLTLWLELMSWGRSCESHAIPSKRSVVTRTSTRIQNIPYKALIND